MKSATRAGRFGIVIGSAKKLEKLEKLEKVVRLTFEKIWRRARDLNPRGFHLPVFKTGALGRYASPPRRNLPEDGTYLKLSENYKLIEP